MCMGGFNSPLHIPHLLHLSNNINYHTPSQNLIYSKIENFIDKFHINEKQNPVGVKDWYDLS